MIRTLPPFTVTLSTHPEFPPCVTSAASAKPSSSSSSQSSSPSPSGQSASSSAETPNPTVSAADVEKNAGVYVAEQNKHMSHRYWSDGKGKVVHGFDERIATAWGGVGAYANTRFLPLPTPPSPAKEAKPEQAETFSWEEVKVRRGVYRRGSESVYRIASDGNGCVLFFFNDAAHTPQPAIEKMWAGKVRLTTESIPAHVAAKFPKPAPIGDPIPTDHTPSPTEPASGEGERTPLDATRTRMMVYLELWTREKAKREALLAQLSLAQSDAQAMMAQRDAARAELAGVREGLSRAKEALAKALIVGALSLPATDAKGASKA